MFEARLLWGVFRNLAPRWALKARIWTKIGTTIAGPEPDRDTMFRPNPSLERPFWSDIPDDHRC